ncbi:probable serine/threonine-protein kinase DDB_G0267686 isoform X1 [Drosophila obscura]|uniref:probable serine/threonine-protein kinase DDB_G0267686 isoform X1 n=1 Tax=Drosophila obscura TaxID=7282 RepID=UPI001BB1888F|nr:probable serine/threonine-protein kinase DDB_G0267686 isoform X1 [Drosophila obscura]
MSDASGYQKLPPGWDCKYDQTTGNCYYINYLTKAMQLEDPRGRSYKQLQNERCSTESIALQQMVSTAQTSSHNSSPYHVYPSHSLTAVRAFQEREQSTLHNISTSPLLSASSKGHLEMSSPLPFQRTRLGGNMSRRSTIQETSFTNQTEADGVVAKIQNMFPTAGENHIRLLLKRYYNSEAVVISALQVEKHPVTMPGPFVTPPAQRHLFHSNSAFYMTPPARRLEMAASRGTSRTASPLPGGRFGSLMSMQSGGHLAQVPPPGAVPPALHGSPQWRSSPKPHSSPKMKLRYMKNIFPKADEMLLLDILANADNNVQFASEKLISLGYTKRDMQQPHKPNNRPPEHPSGDLATQHIPLRPKEYTDEEKANMQTQLKEKYPQIAERIILMALESVNYAEDRATQILQIVQDEDEQRDQKHAATQPKQLDLAKVVGSEQVDGHATDSILTVVVERAPTSVASACAPKPPHKRHILPSINVTTPSTATTQIILDHRHYTPTMEGYRGVKASVEEEEEKEATKPLSSISSASTSHSYVSPAQSPTLQPCYERLTTKSILARASSGAGGGCGSFSPTINTNSYNNLNNSSKNCSISISGYLHGNNSHCNSNSNASSYSSYSTSMTSSSLASANTNSNSSSIAKAIESRARTKNDSLKHRQQSTTFGNSHNSDSSEFQSIIERMATLGANSQLTKGADENLLLADYVTWNGPNTTLIHKQPTQGPDGSLLSDRTYKTTGRNTELCKGAKAGLAKGSIYAQGSNKSPNIKCN